MSELFLLENVNKIMELFIILRSCLRFVIFGVYALRNCYSVAGLRKNDLLVIFNLFSPDIFKVIPKQDRQNS